MNPVIDLRSYVGASRGRLLVMVDLQQKNHAALAKADAAELSRALDNCMSAIRHARNSGIPIAFTRQGDGPAGSGQPQHSAWIAGFEPKRSDMVFELQQASCYGNHLFANIVSQTGSFAIAGLVAEETCLATAIDASRRGHRVTFLRDASASRSRQEADAAAVHGVTTRTIGLFADTAATDHWLMATSQRSLKGHRYG